MSIFPGMVPTLALILPTQGPITGLAGGPPLSKGLVCLASARSVPNPSFYLLGVANPEGHGVEVEESASLRLQKERKGEARKVRMERCHLATFLVPALKGKHPEAFPSLTRCFSCRD